MYEILKPLVLKLFAVEIPEPLKVENTSYKYVRQFQACPSFLRYRLLGWLCLTGAFVSTLLIMNIALFFTDDIFGWIAAIVMDLIILAVIVLMYFSIRIDYEMRSYTVTDRSLRIREGVFFIREMTMTYANIQNVKLSQGPLERYFGFRNLEVETAGGGGSPQGKHKKSPFSFHVGYLRGIDNAEEVRALIQQRMERSGTAKPPKPVTAATEQSGELTYYRTMLDQIKRLRNNLS